MTGEEKEKSFARQSINASNIYEVTGTHTMVVPIYNVIQLLQLVTLCCDGKSDFAEMKCKESILNFKIAASIIKLAGDLWPLKIAIFDYIINAYMDSHDPEFMKKPEADDGGDEDEGDSNKVDDSDVGVLLSLIFIVNQDYEDYLNDKVRQTKLQYPSGKRVPMKTLQEQYIFGTGLEFIKATLKRKTYDVGSVELKFYVLAKNIAFTFYHTKDPK